MDTALGDVLIELNAAIGRAELKASVRRRKTAQAQVLKFRIVLASAEGSQNQQVAVKLGVVPSASSVGALRPTGARAAWRRKADIGLNRAAHLANPRFSAASDEDVQALDRPGFRGQGARCRQPICLPAPACHPPLCEFTMK
ncbi:hypothetical protein [Bradyrhizobium genosp. SA-3]|uniref:hypothetical protein n=1 Tax=Bradyrhizobium genosp. SA-3 TaxID=508868 RepID=UPI001028AEF5|nr:hypothetical protein [Bradyrhizobium genosp. SA-3]